MLSQLTQYRKQSETINSNYLSLLEHKNVLNIFQKVPRTFEICTRDGSCYFNIYIIQELSNTIANYLGKHPDSVKLNIHLDNNKNLKKIEELCQGKLVIFDKNALSGCIKITQMLGIHSFINNDFSHRKTGIILNPECEQFLSSNLLVSFTISTKKKDYFCNNFGICSSKVILDFITSNPNVDRYEYDYADEFNEFQTICDIFNFKEISITTVNIDFLKEIAEDLKIDFILDKIKIISQGQDNLILKVDQTHKIVDKISELFDLLYKINELSVKTVVDSILDSKWSKSEENVKELAAFILQVIHTDILLHPSLMELILQLDSENLKELKILIPLIKNKLLKSLDMMHNNCAFVYRLYKKGIITKEELFSKLKELSVKPNGKLILWFLPELIENGCFKESDLSIFKQTEVNTFIKSYLPDKIDFYIKMRDSFEPDDEITKALRIDDVDTFQSIISIRRIKDISKCYVPYNIFDQFRQQVNYINYAAAFGSIKCFKYLMLNHSKIDSTTFYYSICGGNNEIIKIVDNSISHDYNHMTIDILKFLKTLIKNHRNNLFDWLFDQKIMKYELIRKQLNEITTCAVTNGNAHALVALIDKGFNIFEHEDNEFQKLAASEGFYHLLKFLYSICGYIDEERYHWGKKPFSSYVSFGNLKIFKFYVKFIKQERCIIRVLESAIERNEMNMINYFFDEQINKISKSVINACLIKSLEKDSDELFYTFIEKFEKNCPSIFDKYIWDKSLLTTACKYKQIKPFYTIIKLIKIDNNTDFGSCLYNAAACNSMELCKYLIENKYKFDYLSVFNRLPSASNISYDIILLLFNNSGLKIDRFTFLPLLCTSINNHNINFVKFLLENNLFYDEILIDSVLADDFNITNIVLDYNSSPFFINRGSSEGTALHIAVKKNNLKIVKRLLSIRSINPNLCDKNNQTPFMIVASQYNIPMINEFISFYGKNILLYRDSIYILLEYLFKVGYHSSQHAFSSCKLDKNDNITKILDSLFKIDNIQMIIDEKIKRIILDFCTKSTVPINCVQTFLNLDLFNVNDWSLSTGETILTSAVKSQRIDIINLLVNYPKTNVNMTNTGFETPLHIAVKKNNIEIIRILLSVPSINIFLYDRNNFSPLMIAMTQQSYEILSEFISFCDKNKKIDKDSFNFLLEGLIKGSIGSTGGHNINRRNNNNQTDRKNNCLKLFEMLLNCENINEIFDEKNSKILLEIFSKDDICMKFVQSLLNIDKIDVNVASPSNGNTPLILALKSGNSDIATLLIQNPKTNINMINFNHESALTVAAEKGLVSIVKLLINDSRFDPNESRAGYAFVISKGEISEILLSMNLFDVNYVTFDIQRNSRNRWGDCYTNFKTTQKEDTALLQAVENNDLIKFENIIKHPTFDKEKSKLHKAAQNLFALKQKNILCDFIKVLNENGLLDYCFQVIQPFHSLINSGNISILDDITNGKISNLVISDDFLLKLFYSSLKVSDNSIKLMTFLIDYDKKHNNVLDFKEKSFLTHISRSNWMESKKFKYEDVENIVNFIIEKGGDVNKPNKEGFYPLQYAILIQFGELVRALINTSKVNYNQLINIHEDYFGNDDDDNIITNDDDDNIITNDDEENDEINATETYLHSAVRSCNYKIFKLIYNLNVFDINARNSLNETPLLLSCEFLNSEIVRILFKNESLDFHCKNNKNEDALTIVQFFNKEINKDELDNMNALNDSLSKEQYFEKLINAINEQNGVDDDNIYSDYDYDDDDSNKKEK